MLEYLEYFSNKSNLDFNKLKGIELISKNSYSIYLCGRNEYSENLLNSEIKVSGFIDDFTQEEANNFCQGKWQWRIRRASILLIYNGFPS
jgi:hypothetical protein